MAMSSIAFFFLVVFLAITLVVLTTGVIAMMQGGEFNRKYANKLMRARILFQFLALVFLALYMLTADG